MARFDLLKPAALKLWLANSALLHSKAFRAAIGACVFCFALGTGLSYLIVRTAQNQQLTALAEVSERSGQIFRKRLIDLDADVHEVAQRVGQVTAQLVDAAYVAGTPPPDGAVPPEPGSAAQIGGTTALETRWRKRLEDSLAEMMRSREDVLDITYLGRFTAIPNGALTVVRVERTRDGALQTSQDDPRADWDAAFLQTVIQSDIDTALISAPVVSGVDTEGDDASRSAIVRGADPIRDQDGAVVGVAMVSVELSGVLNRMVEGLPEGTRPLLVTDAGVALLHPASAGMPVQGSSGTEFIDNLYPGLVEDFERNPGAASHAFSADTFVAHLLRFTVGGHASDVRYSLVLSAPHEDVDIASAVRSAGILGVGLVGKPSPSMFAAGAAAGLLLSATSVLGVRRKRRRAAVRDEGAETDELTRRARAIEAEQSRSIDDRASDNADSTPASDASAHRETEDRSDDALEARSADESEVGNAAVLGASEKNEAVSDINESIEVAQVESDHADSHDESTRSSVAREPVSPQREEESFEPAVRLGVSQASLHSARELAEARGRLEDELNDARQRSLNELAAARERFELELAGERDRAIARLIEESRAALDGSAQADDTARAEAALPPIEPAEFDLRNLLAEVSAWMEGETFGRDTTFGVHCSRDVPNQLTGDRDWLGPLLVNLGKLALRASDGGPVELNVSCADEGVAGARVCFEVRARDTGFVATPDGRLRERRPGSLALVEELLRAMHGEVRGERLSNEESALRVVLPTSFPR